MCEGTVSLDETTMDRHHGAMPRMRGFAGERISVLARPLLREALGLPLTSRLLVTDCGYFPDAADHRRSRTEGSPQAIVIVCVDGAGWCRLPSGRSEVAAGQALVIPPGVPHSYGAAADDPWTIWWLHVGGEDVAELVGATLADPERPVVPVGDVYQAVALIDDVLTRMERDDSVRSRQAAAGAAWHLLALLAAGQTGAPASRNEAIQQAEQYLRDHLGARTSVAELAALARLSPSHFAALFRRATGTGVLQYQTRLRMSRARELLDTTALAVAEIARTLGYADPFYFSRQFRSVHGTSPTAYRVQRKG
ncbi:MAG: MmsAB operon regulatory protein [Actinoallomurus sp.]|jgi:AraC family transcriptional regulator of arabinose operon|nr:MmsAB operon regulatory protein [Actinoallomurus sp.]